MSRGLTCVIVLAAAIGLAAAWAFTPLRTVLSPRELLAAAEDLRASGWGLLLVPPAFVLLSVAMVPTSVLRWTTVIAFDPVFGVLFMVLGVLGATFLGHAIGARLGAERVGGERIERLRARLTKTAAAGAAGVRRGVFLGGTLVGMVPGVIVMVLAGGSLRAWLLG